MAGPWENYQAQPQPDSGPWAKYGAPPPTATKPEGAVTRFLTRATGLPVGDIIDHPNAYLNPFSSESTPTRDAFQHAAQHPEEMTGEIRVPGKQAYQDIKAHNYAGAAGDVIPSALALASMVGGGFRGPAMEPEILPPNAAPPRLTGEIAPAPIPRAPEPAPAPYRQGPGSVVPDVVGPTNPNVLAGNKGVIVRPRLQLSGEAPTEFPIAPPAPTGEVIKAPPGSPTGRADYLEDQAIREGMSNDLYRQAQTGGREMREQFEAGHSMDKPKYIRQLEAESQQIMAEAAQRAQQHIQDGIDRFTRPVTSKLQPGPLAAKSAEQIPQTTKPQDLEQALRDSIAQAQAAKEPVRVDFDENGNITDADGRHRVIAAVKRGDPYIEVQTKLRDGSVQTLKVAPSKVAAKIGVTPESLDFTDDQQAQYSAPAKSKR